MQNDLERAVALAHAGKRSAARELLRVVLRRDPNNLAAWKWYAHLAQDRRAAAAAIQNVLRIDPGDVWARRAMDQLAAQRPEARPGRRRSRSALAFGAAALLMVVVIVVGGLGLLALSEFNERLEALAAAPGPTPTDPSLGFQQPPTVVVELPPASSTPQPSPTTPPPSAPTSSVDVITEVSYYAVQGSSEEELREQLYTLGPYSERLGENVLATTAYEMSVDWTMNDAPSQCGIVEAVVTLDMEYIYPRWDAPTGVSEDLIIKWNDFIARVKEHEEIHGQIAVDCAHDLAEAVAALPPQSDCDALNGLVHTTVDEMYATCDARQLQFDEEEGGDTFP